MLLTKSDWQFNSIFSKFDFIRTSHLMNTLLSSFISLASNVENSYRIPVLHDFCYLISFLHDLFFFLIYILLSTQDGGSEAHKCKKQETTQVYSDMLSVSYSYYYSSFLPLFIWNVVIILYLILYLYLVASYETSINSLVPWYPSDVTGFTALLFHCFTRPWITDRQRNKQDLAKLKSYSFPISLENSLNSFTHIFFHFQLGIYCILKFTFKFYSIHVQLEWDTSRPSPWE